MKVAIVTHFPEDPELPRGGVEAVSVNLTRALAAFDDLDLHIITLDARISSPQLTPWSGGLIHRLPGFGGSALLNATGRGRQRISQYLQELGPDIVHAHDTYGLMVKGLPFPRVFTIHGFIHADTRLSRTRWSRIRSGLWKWAETRGWADQPHIVSISPYVRERLSGICKGIIHDIDNPISESFFHIPRREQKGVILSAAVISRRKNTHCLIRALEILLRQGHDLELRIAGEVVEPEYGRLLEESIRRSGLEERVALLGRVSSGQIREELARASVFALVSLEEGSPMGIEEAMAAGLPIVASNRCGMPYMVRHGENGFLVNPLDTEDVARRLGQIDHDDRLREHMGRCSQAISLERYHPDAVARRTREVYLQAMETWQSPPRI